MCMKKVLIVDPWGRSGLDEYTSGLCEGLKKKGVDVLLCTNKHSPISINGIDVKKFFFWISEVLTNRTMLRKLIRGFEYIYSWVVTVFFVAIFRPDVIHIQWFLMYRADLVNLFFLRLLCRRIKIVYTAHNIVPHNSGDKYIDELGDLYASVDTVVVHGQKLKSDLLSLFPFLDASKVCVMPHGAKNISLNYEFLNVPSFLREKMESKKKVFLFLGLMRENKGVDLLYKVWRDCDHKNSLLVLAGRKDDSYNELSFLEDEIHNDDSVVYYPYFMNTDTVSFLFDKACVVVLPYRNGSVSGVLFNAAAFSKPVLLTRFGSIEEYVIDDVTAKLIDFDYDSMLYGLRYCLSLSSECLTTMGEKNNAHIYSCFSWEAIANDMIDHCY